MKKRLRKKKRIGEFQQFGFEVGFRFPDHLERHSSDNITDKFIEEAIENNNLQFGGGGDSEWNGFITLEGAKGSTTDNHRELVKQWFIQEPDILEYYVSPLTDAWYGDFCENEFEWIKKAKDQITYSG